MDNVEPTATVVTKSRRVPIIWIIPLVAVAIGIWLAWDTLSKEGPTLTLSFEAAEGLKAGESTLKFKGITVGTAQRLDFSPDHRHVLVTVATTSAIREVLTDDSEFWVVKPELFAGSLRGVGTLLSGPYIEMRPGTATSQGRRRFVGLEDPPVLEADIPGSTYLVKAPRLGSLSVGSPVFFRDLSVGQVLGWDLGDMAENAMLHVFVRKPFDGYVNSSSRFWNASGVKLDVGGGGMSLQIESLKALLLGGIAFTTPDPGAPKTVALEQVFPLFDDREAADAAAFRRSVQCVAYFAGSVRGVTPGNDVTLRGLKIGHITSVAVRYDAATDSIVAPVEFEVSPERVVGIGRRVYATPAEGVQALVNKGLRATLSSASLLTGQMLLSLDFVKGAAPVMVTQYNGRFVIPSTGGGGLGGLQEAATTLLNKVNTIPFDSIGAHVDETLGNFADLTRGPQLHQSLTELAATLASARDVLRNLDSDAGPAFKRLPQIAADLQGTMLSANRLVSSLNSGYGDNTKFSRDLVRLMLELNDAVRSIRSLTDLLSRHPEALIRGRSGGGTE